jgi:hypothetical protein
LVTHSRRALTISGGTARFLPDTVPRSLAKTGSSSRTLYASSECSHPYLPRARLSASLRTRVNVSSELLPWGCVPSSRHQPAASLQRSSTFAAIRPRRFARPRRFVPPLTLRVYFTPLPRPGFYPSGLSPPSTAEPIRHRSVPSRRLAMVAYVRLPARASFHSPALRALFRAKSPLRLRQCYPTHRPLPSWAFSSSRFSLSTPLEASSCLLPPMAFRRFRESSSMTFSVLPV